MEEEALSYCTLRGELAVIGKVCTDEEEGQGPFRAVHTVGTRAQL